MKTGVAVPLLRAWEERNTSWSPELNRPMVAFAFAQIGLHLPDAASILDLGCGDGHMAGLFAGVAKRTVGVDLSFAFARGAAVAQPECSFACAAAERLPFRDRSFDVVYAGSVLQYTGREEALRDCARVLRPGGLFVTIENLHGSPVALAARAFIRITRRPYPPHQTPRHHLRRREAALYLRHFASMETRVFNLTTPLLFIASRIVRVPFARRLYAWLHALDRKLLDNIPLLESAGWHIVICARL